MVIMFQISLSCQNLIIPLFHYLAIISQNKLSKVSYVILLTSHVMSSYILHAFLVSWQHCRFVLVVPEFSEGGYKGLFCFEK